MKHEIGVLAAGTAFGKTVVAAWMIAVRKVSTLVLVNRKPLMAQWVERLSQFLGIEKNAIGCWGGGRHALTGRIDVALIQSLTRKGEVNGRIIGSYGQLIVDECHGISAPSFERVANAFSGRFVLGLSATVIRKDGHHPIIHMQCGPVRHRVEAKDMSAFEVFKHRVEVKVTGFQSNCSIAEDEEGKSAYVCLVNELLQNESRNEMIIEDVLKAVSEGRSPVVLTERREHLEILRAKLQDKIEHVLVLHGGMGAKQLKALEEERLSIPDSDARVLLATGSFLGEGFDDARLDTLFLTLPISWKARSATEAFLFKHLDSLPKTRGMFKLNARLDVPFGPNPYTEVDLLSKERHLAIEIDGPHHFENRDAYRRDRRKDVLLQENGYFVLRFLAEDVIGCLNEVMDVIARRIA